MLDSLILWWVKTCQPPTFLLTRTQLCRHHGRCFAKPRGRLAMLSHEKSSVAQDSSHMFQHVFQHATTNCNSTAYIHIFWANYNMSLTWNKAIWGWFPLLTMIPVRSQWGRYNLPRYIEMCVLQNVGTSAECTKLFQLWWMKPSNLTWKTIDFPWRDMKPSDSACEPIINFRGAKKHALPSLPKSSQIYPYLI